MNSIPDELLLHMFEFLSPEENDSNLQAVSRRFRSISQSDLLWYPRVMQMWKDETLSFLPRNWQGRTLPDSPKNAALQEDTLKVIQLLSSHQGVVGAITPWRMQYETMRFRNVKEILWVSQMDGARLSLPTHVPESSGNRFWVDLEARVSDPVYEAAREWYRRMGQHESFCLHPCVGSLEEPLAKGKKWAVWPAESKACGSKCPLSLARVSFEEVDGKRILVTKTRLQRGGVLFRSDPMDVFFWGQRTAREVEKLYQRRPGIFHSPLAFVWQCGFERFNSQTLKEWLELDEKGKIAREQVAQSKGFCGALHGPGDISYGRLKYECRHVARSNKALIHACAKCAIKWQKENGCTACPDCITPLGQNEVMYERDELGFKRRKLLRPKYLDSVWK